MSKKDFLNKMEYETVIGLEVHLHLATVSKAFCGCSTKFGNEPNSQTCPVCLGLPGSLPVLNKKALEYAIKVALTLNCEVRDFVKFDRKNYYYPDLPKNYQISQYDLPLSSNGYLDIKINPFDAPRDKARGLLRVDTESGICCTRPEGRGLDAAECINNQIKRIGITRVHMEEDAGKLIHDENKNFSLVDYNRSGIPLLEIVSEPDMNSPEEAYEYLTALKLLLKYLDVSDCDMEKGSLRCDANVSLRKAGDKNLGVKTELKNMNSFKAVKEALQFEINRQSDLLNEGEKIVQETRLWDALKQLTISMRSKEEAQDYRYFPEPDLVPFVISKDEIENIRKSLPESAQERLERFIKDYNLSEYDANSLVQERSVADYFEQCVKIFSNPKRIANWINSQIMAEMNDRQLDINSLKLSPESLVELIKFVNEGAISNLAAKDVLSEMLNSGKKAKDVIAEKNLGQVSDTAALEKFCDEVIKENEKTVLSYKAGKENALMHLVGQVMKKSQGKANPKIVQEILRRRI